MTPQPISSIAWVHHAVKQQRGDLAVVMCDDTDRVHIFTAAEARALATRLNLAANLTDSAAQESH